MNEKLYTLCGAMALALAACSEDGGNIGGTSTEPNTVYAEGSSLWNPQSGDYDVNTARYASTWPKGAVQDGRWFWETTSDDADGGLSRIVWPVDLDDGPNPLAPVIESCGGICGTAVLDKGDLYYNPFVTVGFAMAMDSTGNPMPVDVSNWDGICVTYTSDCAPSLELDMGDSVNVALRYGLPQINLPKAREPVTKCVRWSNFKTPAWLVEIPEYWEEDTGNKASKQLVAVRFRVQGAPGSYNFNISYVGTVAEHPASDKLLPSSSSRRALVVSSSSQFVLGGGDGGLWTPTNDADRVKTSLYSEIVWPENAVEDGRWYWTTDENAGGKSSVVWPVALGKDESLIPVVDSCKGICGVASLKNGTNSAKPYVSLDFGIAKDGAGKPLPVDVSNWSGVCVEYYSESDLLMELVLEDSLNAQLGYNLPSVKLKKSLSATKLCESWNTFNLPEGLGNVPEVLKEWNRPELSSGELNELLDDGWKLHVGENAAKRLVAVRFKVQADEGDYKFGIGAIGTVRRNFQSNSNLPICVRAGRSASCGEDLWWSGSGTWHIKTSTYAGRSWPSGAVEDGEWFVETDEEKGGASSFAWLRFPGLEDYERGLAEYEGEWAMQFIVSKCFGLCGTASLDRGTMAEDPYVSMGFNLAKDSAGKAVPVDVSNWGGMCFDYFSDMPLMLELDLGDSLNTLLGAKPFVSLPVKETKDGAHWSEMKCVSWGAFELPANAVVPESWGGKIGENAAKRLATIRFKMQSSTNRENAVYVGRFGSYYDKDALPEEDR